MTCGWRRFNSSNGSNEYTKHKNERCNLFIGNILFFIVITKLQKIENHQPETTENLQYFITNRKFHPGFNTLAGK